MAEEERRTLLLPKGVKHSNCPYCAKPEGFVTQGVQAKKITPEAFLDLLNNGWRRFGDYLWVQEEGICCRQYPIRVNVHSAIMNKDKTKVWKAIERFCRKGEVKAAATVKKGPQAKPQRRPSRAKDHHHHVHQPRTCPKGHEMQMIPVSGSSRLGFQDKCSLCMQPGVLCDPKGHFMHCGECKLSTHSDERCSWQKHPRCPAGHEMKRISEASKEVCDVCLDNTVPSSVRYSCHVCRITTHETCRWPRVPPCHSCGVSMQYFRSQTVPEGYKSAHCDVCSEKDIQKGPKGYYHCGSCLTDRHRDGCKFKNFSTHIIGSITEGMVWRYEGTNTMEVRVVKPTVTDAKFDLFLKYQREVHGETEGKLSVLTIGDDDAGQSDRDLFKKYLVDSPVVDGTYHFEYFINDKLFMVTVADILPDCINSVYCFYDPDVKKLGMTPGKFSVLFEMEWMKKQHSLQTFNYYYLGMYFDHPKMTYKADYKPSEILTSEGVWKNLEDVNFGEPRKAQRSWVPSVLVLVLATALVASPSYQRILVFSGLSLGFLYLETQLNPSAYPANSQASLTHKLGKVASTVDFVDP